MKALITICVLVFLILAFSNCRQKACIYHTPYQLMSTRGCEDDTICAYWDYVVADSLYRDCIDSAETVKILSDYIKNRSDKNKMYGVSLLNKVQDFDRGEDLSQPKSFFNNVLIAVYFDTSSYKPTTFVFYNSDHKEIYRGKQWMRRN